MGCIITKIPIPQEWYEKVDTPLKASRKKPEMRTSLLQKCVGGVVIICLLLVTLNLRPENSKLEEHSKLEEPWEPPNQPFAFTRVLWGNGPERVKVKDEGGNKELVWYPPYPEDPPAQLGARDSFLPWIEGLKWAEWKVFSQFGEDGINHAIFGRPEVGSGDKKYVEFGVQDGMQCTTRLLRTHFGWSGLMMDGGHTNPDINLRQEFIKPDSIVSLFEKYDVPKKADYMMVDLDRTTYWILEELLKAGYRATVLTCEINGGIPTNRSLSATLPKAGGSLVEHREKEEYDYYHFFGASILAFVKLLYRHDYLVIHCDHVKANIWSLPFEKVRRIPGGQAVLDSFAKNTDLQEALVEWAHRIDRSDSPIPHLKTEGFDKRNYPWVEV